MKKFKMLSFSLIAALSLGVSTQVTNVQASESLVPEISQTSDEIFVSRTVPFTHVSSMWVTETRNGKTYSGYLYNRGQDAATGKLSIFNGDLKAGPYVDPFLLEDN